MAWLNIGDCPSVELKVSREARDYNLSQLRMIIKRFSTNCVGESSLKVVLEV